MTKYKNRILTHVLGWLAYVLVIAFGADELDADFLAKSGASFLPVIAIFYAAIGWLFPFYLPQKRYGALIIGLSLVSLMAVGLRFWLAQLANHMSGQHLLDDSFSSITFWNQFRLNLMFIGISFAYWYARRNHEIEQNQQLLEKAVLNARLASLKNQINPHFLYNTLSFLYTKALPLSRELSEAIADLSDMMRYSLEEAGENGQVDLSREVAHLRNFIQIHQFRFEHRLHIKFEVGGSLNGYSIMPLLLITFVENAFKHGRLDDPDHPLCIQLQVNATELFFSVSNRKSSGRKERSSGIGLPNVRNRLELAYPKAHTLVIENGRDDYRVSLHLTLN
ncbi:sensor histidine kinase [Ravibacter arvi]|uniref:Sensor histidine kinase n=1 Tax=Ravibacter arvi TaxID=2051041 RepID=A0ABP8M9G4_9BACT